MISEKSDNAKGGGIVCHPYTIINKYDDIDRSCPIMFLKPIRLHKRTGRRLSHLYRNITKIDHTRRSLTLANGEIIPIENIYDIQF